MLRPRDHRCPCSIWSCCVTASPPGTPRTCSPAGSTSTSPRPARTRPGRAAALLAAEAGPRPADPAHLGAHPGHPHRRDRAGRGRTELAPGPPALAAQRAPLRGPPGQEQDRRSAELGDEQFIAWRRSYDIPPPPLARRPLRAQATPATATCPRTTLPAPSAWPTWWAGSSPTGRTPSCPTCGPGGPGRGRAGGGPRQQPAGPAQAPRGIADADITGLEIPTGIPYRYRLATTSRCESRRLPRRPGRGRGGRAAAVATPGGPSRRPSATPTPDGGRAGAPRRAPATPTVGRRRTPATARRRPARPCAPAPRSRPGRPRPCRHRSCRWRPTATMASTTSSAWASSTRTSMRILGTKSTSYSAPR